MVTMWHYRRLQRKGVVPTPVNDTAVNAKQKSASGTLTHQH